MKLFPLCSWIYKVIAYTVPALTRKPIYTEFTFSKVSYFSDCESTTTTMSGVRAGVSLSQLLAEVDRLEREMKELGREAQRGGDFVHQL